MEEIKNIIGIIAVLLTFFGYMPYIMDTMRGKTKPHVFTWFLWSLITFIAFCLQISHGAGIIGSFVTLAATIVCFIIFILGMRLGDKDITKLDKILLVLALFTIVMWPFTNLPVLAAIILSIADIVSFIPTIRKSWNKPYTETLSSYMMNVIRFSLGLFALKSYSLITTLYPTTWLIANGLFSMLLIMRRKQVGKR